MSIDLIDGLPIKSMPDQLVEIPGKGIFAIDYKITGKKDALLNCEFHIDWIGEVCPDCSLMVDEYGNTEDKKQFCCFPDCGCDGSRLCDAENGSSLRAQRQNVEGMWQNGSNKKCFEAVGELMVSLKKEERDKGNA